MTRKITDQDQDAPLSRLPDHKAPAEEESYPSGTAQPIKDPPGTGYNKPRPGYPTK